MAVFVCGPLPVVGAELGTLFHRSGYENARGVCRESTGSSASSRVETNNFLPGEVSRYMVFQKGQ